MLSVIPTSLVSAAPVDQRSRTAASDQVVLPDASTLVDQGRGGRSWSDRVEAAPPVSAPQAPNAVNIVATKRDAVVNDVDGDGRADPGDTLRYTVVITNSGDTDATSVVFNDTIDDNTVLSGTIKSTPLARNDAYTAVGNMRIALAAGSGVLANDNDPDGSPISVVISTTTSANGGNVAANADGSFTYNPPPGFEGADTFTYTIQDTDGNQNSATVTVTVSGMIWFINNNAGACSSGCDGRLTTPFTTLAAFAASNNGTGNNPAANDNIFVYESATAYTGGVTLLNGQRLIGQDATNNLSAITGLTPPAYSDPLPGMNTGGAATTLANSGGNGITVASNNTLRGLTVGNTTGAGISGTSFGTLTIGTAGSPDVTISDSGQALSLNTGTLAAVLTSITSSGGTNNIALTSVGGSLTSGSTTLSNATGVGLSVSTSSAALNLGNTAVTSSGGTGISLSGNAGSLTFADLDIAPDANQRALHATNNTGALIATSGTIATSNGIAVEVVGPSSASRTPLNLQLTSVSANGGMSGIILSNTSVTGSPGGFTIAGSGGTCSTAGNCTGGAIQNSTGVGISLVNANNVSLTRLFIGSTGGHGISGSGMADSTGGARPTFEIRNSRLTSPGDADNETAMFFGNSLAPGNNTGRLVMADTIVEQFEENGLEVYNNSGILVIDVTGTLSGLTDSTTKFDDNSDVHGQQGIMATAAGTAVLTFNVSGVYFNNIEFVALDARAEGSVAVIDVNWTGNVSINGGGPDNFPAGGGFQIVQDKGGSSTFDILNNNIRDLQGDGIVIIADGPTQGRINNNAVSGSLVGDGVRIDTEQLPGEGNSFTVTIQVQGNNIGNDATFPGIGDDGIQILHRDGTKTLNLTVENNTIANTVSEAIRYFTDADVSDGALQPKSFVRFAGNTFTNTISDSVVLDTAVPTGTMTTLLTLFPEDPSRFVAIARQTGIDGLGPHKALLVQADDQ
ncbi:MAG: cadherin-like domain-containing protein, partial [Chloroflexi bacterium]|nr:cadherin-like domain-containing protein [Chloroflexota bacterium]